MHLVNRMNYQSVNTWKYSDHKRWITHYFERRNGNVTEEFLEM